jgi:hypothetical protein
MGPEAILVSYDDDVAFEALDDGIMIRRVGKGASLRGRFAKSGMAARLLADRGEEPEERASSQPATRRSSTGRRSSRAR